MSSMGRSNVISPEARDIHAAARETDAAHYTYRGRSYRVRRVSVTVAEMGTPVGGRTVMPARLTDELLTKIASGEASEVNGDKLSVHPINGDNQ